MDPTQEELGPVLEWPGHEDNPDDRPLRPDAAAPVSADAPSEEEAMPKPDPGVSEERPRAMAFLPAITHQVENLTNTISTLSMRLDTVSSAVASLRSTLSERLTDYSESLATVVRSQSDTVEEYRHNQDRAIADLRRSIVATDEALRKLTGRLEELLAAPRGLSEFVGSDGFDPNLASHAVLANLDAAAHALSEQLESAAQVPTQQSNDEIVDELHLLRDEVQALKRRVGLRARAPVSLDDEQLEAIASAVGSTQGTRLTDTELERIVDSIVKRLEAMIEVVPDEEPVPTDVAARKEPAPAAREQPEPAPRSRRRSS